MNPKYKFDAISFGMRLQKIRNFYEKTQEDVAEYVGVSVKSVQNWEKGDKLPGIDHVVLLGQCFNMTVGEILEDEAYRIFEKKADARKRIIEIVEVPGRIEAFIEFAEDRYYDRYEAWIWDEYANIKYLCMSVAKLISYEEFKNSVLYQADSFLEEYRERFIETLTDSAEGEELKGALNNKIQCESVGMAAHGAVHVVDKVIYFDNGN